MTSLHCVYGSVLFTASFSRAIVLTGAAYDILESVSLEKSFVFPFSRPTSVGHESHQVMQSVHCPNCRLFIVDPEVLVEITVTLMTDYELYRDCLV